MRDIEFRGIVRLDNSANRYWKYGTLMRDTAGDYAIGEIEIGKVVIPDRYSYVVHDSIGQYTGLKDRNGKKIFEGDILRYRYVYDNDNNIFKEEGDSFDDWEKGVVKWGGEYPAFDIYPEVDIDCNGLQHIIESGEYWIEITGNIHENIQLLETKK